MCLLLKEIIKNNQVMNITLKCGKYYITYFSKEDNRIPTFMVTSEMVAEGFYEFDTLLRYCEKIDQTEALNEMRDTKERRAEASMGLTKNLNGRQRRQLKKLLHRNNRKTQQEIIREFIIEYGSNPDPELKTLTFTIRN